MHESNIWGTMFPASFLVLLLHHLVTWLLIWRSGRLKLDFGVRWRGLEGGEPIFVSGLTSTCLVACMCLCAIFLFCLFLSVCLSVCLCVMMNCRWEEQGSLGRDCCSHFLPKLATSHSSHSHQGARSLNLILFYTHSMHCRVLASVQLNTTSWFVLLPRITPTTGWDPCV